MAFNSFQYMILILALSIGTYFIFIQLASMMATELADGTNANVSISWIVTQKQVMTEIAIFVLSCSSGMFMFFA